MRIKAFLRIASSLIWITALGSCNTLPLQSVSPQDPLVLTPEEVVEGFYNWYTEYPGNPNQGAYRASPFLTESLMDSTAEIVAGFQMGGYDPFLCAQDIPDKIYVNAADISGQTAEIRVTSSFGGHEFKVLLVQEDGEWKIDEVRCR
jgi:hypothetical protein